MSPVTPVAFLSRIRQNLANFHPMERRLAEFIIDFPGDVASYTASELASLAGVSNATVTRFIKRLGYQHYEDARRHVREEKEAGSPLFLSSRSSGAGIERRFAATLARSHDNLERTLARLDEAEIDRIAKAMLGARKIWITGFRSSQSFATYLRWQIFQVKEDTLVIPNAGDTLGQYAASMTRRDVVVVFGLRRRPAGLQQVLTQIVSSGARVLYITDEQSTRNTELTWQIQCLCESTGPLDDHVAVLAICHLLTSRILDLSGHQARERLLAIESSYDALHEL